MQQNFLMPLYVSSIIMRIISSFKQFFQKTNSPMSKYPKDQLKKKLNSMQYKVTQQNGTQPPYKNQYYNFFKQGIYNCIVCNKELFTSDMKFDSGCGWPAFYDEIKQAKINKKTDYAHGMVRTEVRCSECDSHLGHIFQDGPADKTGIRYCINSASINFNKK